MNIYDKLYDPSGIDYGKTRTLARDESTDRERMIFNELLRVLERFNLPENAKILEVGAAMGFNHTCHPGYIGIEYSKIAVRQAKDRFGPQVNIAEGDVTNLKFDGESFDFIFSFSTLEHVPEIEKAFTEIIRVLKKGGIAYLSPAWNCRPWTVEKIDVIPYSHLTLWQKFEKLLIPIRENIIFRFLLAFPQRLLGESLRVMTTQAKLRYKCLHPKMDLIQKYGHVPDDDAFVSIDSHSAMIWFLKKGQKIESHPTFVKRIFCRGEAITIVKQ